MAKDDAKLTGAATNTVLMEKTKHANGQKQFSLLSQAHLFSTQADLMTGHTRSHTFSHTKPPPGWNHTA